VTAPRPIAAPPKVIDLMDALKRSLVASGALPAAGKARRAKAAGSETAATADAGTRRQRRHQKAGRGETCPGGCGWSSRSAAQEDGQLKPGSGSQ